MIIWGSQTLTGRVSSGEFHCPGCRSRQAYHQRRVRKFFTLYFIPLIPTQVLGQYIECGSCRATYDLEVLKFDPAEERKQFEAKFQHAVRHVMLLMALADGKVDSSEIEAVKRIYQQLTSAELSDGVIDVEIRQLQAARQNVEAYTADVSAMLNDHGKEMVFKAACLVAAADGEFHFRESDLLKKIGQALGMSSAHVMGVMRETLGD